LTERVALINSNVEYVRKVNRTIVTLWHNFQVQVEEENLNFQCCSHIFH